MEELEDNLIIKKTTMQTIEKVSENEIEVTKTETVTNTYRHTFEYLTSQREAIETQKAEQIAQRDEELAEIDGLLVECGKLNVSAKPVIEPTPIKEVITK